MIDHLFYILNHFHFATIEFSNKQFVAFIQRNSVWIFNSAVVDTTEKASGWSDHMDTVVMVISCQDLVFAVRGDASWLERSSLRRSSMAGVSKSNFSKMADHHDSPGSPISHANIRVLVFSYVFNFVVF